MSAAVAAERCANDLLVRLTRVHQVAPDRWRAICPAHESRHRTQSHAIRELGDGTLLLKCFAGCGVGEIVAAVGMQIGDLFPRDHSPPADGRRPQRAKHWHSLREAVQTLAGDAFLVVIAAENVAAGTPLSEDDRKQIALAAGRIRAAVEACS